MGFGADVRNDDDRGVGEIFTDLEPEDLLLIVSSVVYHQVK
jgi:ATP-dependent Clp protease ATP-binding subunit ClpX